MIEGMVVVHESNAGLAGSPHVLLLYLRQKNSSVEERNGC